MTFSCATKLIRFFFLSLSLFLIQVGDATDTIVPDANSQSKHHHHHHHHHTTHAGGKKKRVPIHETLSSAELFKLYNMLNGVKLDLLWGRNSEEQPEEIEMIEEQNAAAAAAAVAASVTSSNAVLVSPPTNGNDSKGHARRPSTASVASSNSATTLSDSDSEISTENDSGIESEQRKHETDKSRDLAKQYRKHLLGLYRCLEQMTDAANYLTARYQSDIGPV